MALNISFAGFVYDKDAIIGNANIYYQAYFYNNGTASSSSKWNSVRIIESTGYFSFNLGDGDFLSQTGVALNNAKVIIVFWKGNSDRTADCSLLTEWGATELTIDGSDTYVINTQTKDNIAPNLIWSTTIPAHPYVDTSYSVINNSNDEHQWTFNTTTMYHWYLRYGQVINGPNFIDHTNIYWGDGTNSLNLGNTSGGSHSWTTSGEFDITVEVFDDCNTSVSGTDTFRLYWHEPVPNIIMTPSNPLPNEPIYFEYSGSDIDDRIISIEWLIEDSGIYGTTNTSTVVSKSDTVFHTAGLGTDWYGQSAISGAFTNPGAHTVSISILWNDGFSNQTIIFDKDFVQNKFSGPTLNFYQVPASATVGSGVAFVNNSTNVSRVGLGLPDHEEYAWNWEEGVSTGTVVDQNYSYELNRIFNSTDCSIELCADWSDGWDTMITCVSKAVVFKTTVTVTPEDCYYKLKVIGTSSNGTTSGYSWTVSSGTSSTGPWENVWSSPINIDQEEKTICFSSTGWYKIEGFVYGTGTTTSDSSTLYIDQTCPDSGAVYTIWNGTGVLDIGSDWVHENKGVESPTAVYQGTNGILVSNSVAGDTIVFHRHGFFEIDINNYDFLSFWINLKKWESKKNIRVKLYSTQDDQQNSGIFLDLSNYLMLNSLNTWQRVMIPLKRFRIKPDKTQVGWPTHVNSLIFEIQGKHDFWLDNVSLVMGELITLPICTPTMETYQVGNSPSAQILNVQPCSTVYPSPINL